jgi:DNA-binding MarR family transcriptional regulator
MSDPRVETVTMTTPRTTPALAESKAAGSNLLFLREEEIRLAQDLLFFAYRDFTGAADVILDELGLGRAHHRALHFIGRNPQTTVTELLAILRITKQSLARVLSVLVDQGYVAQAPGRDDRRQRLARQRERLSAAYRDAGGPAVEGFRRVMRGVMDEAARAYMDRAEAASHDGRPRQG